MYTSHCDRACRLRLFHPLNTTPETPPMPTSKPNGSLPLSDLSTGDCGCVVFPLILIHDNVSNGVGVCNSNKTMWSRFMVYGVMWNCYQQWTIFNLCNKSWGSTLKQCLRGIRYSSRHSDLWTSLPIWYFVQFHVLDSVIIPTWHIKKKKKPLTQGSN